jgi:hypothetical protein
MAFAWSWSAITMYELCPKKYYHLKVIKDVKDADSAFSGEGKDTHVALHKRVINKVLLPLPLRHLEGLVKPFVDTQGEKHGELQLALNRNFEPCDWFDKNTYVRAIIDLLIIKGGLAIIIDWKTGKVRPDFGQIKLSAAVLARVMPELERFRLTYVWTKHKEISPPVSMEMKHMTDVWADMIPRADEIEKAIKTTDFPAIENPLCRWCPVKQCPHNKS